MPSQKFKDLLQGYMEHTGHGEIDESGDAIRDEIEWQVQSEDAQAFWGSDPEGDQLAKPLSRVLKDDSAKIHDTQRNGAKGVVG